MSKPITLTITDAQLEALLDMADEYEAQIGGANDDDHRKRIMRLFSRFCERNCIERNSYAPIVGLSIPDHTL